MKKGLFIALPAIVIVAVLDCLASVAGSHYTTRFYQTLMQPQGQLRSITRADAILLLVNLPDQNNRQRDRVYRRSLSRTMDIQQLSGLPVLVSTESDQQPGNRAGEMIASDLHKMDPDTSLWVNSPDAPLGVAGCLHRIHQQKFRNIILVAESYALPAGVAGLQQSSVRVLPVTIDRSVYHFSAEDYLPSEEGIEQSAELLSQLSLRVAQLSRED